MFKMVIESDHEKLKKDGKLSPQEFDNLLRILCLDTGFKESSSGHYYLDEEEDELGCMLVLDVKFDKLGFIVPYLKTWVTYSDEEGMVDQLADEDAL